LANHYRHWIIGFGRRCGWRVGMNLQIPAALLRRLRLNEARTLLRNTRLPLDELAMRS
jgi:AraC-like DNA-binding protein